MGAEDARTGRDEARMTRESSLVLLVEDNPADAELATEGLREAEIDAALVVVDNGTDALRFLRRQGRYRDAPRPTLVLLDLNMPGIDGRQVLSAIKQDPDLNSIPIVVLSSSRDEADIERSYRLGANAYVRKSVGFDEFVEHVRTIDAFWLRTAELPS